MNNLIIGIILLLILLILFIKLKTFFYNQDWDMYRIGDLFFNPIDSPFYSKDKNERVSVLYHKDKYPQSIASEYLKRNVGSNFKEQNIELIKQIIEEKKNKIKIDIPDDTELVLHIRVGDVLCLKIDWGNEYYSRKNNKEWWDSIIKYIKENNITKVTIMAGIHINECIKESEEYIEDRTKFLMENSSLNSNNINIRKGNSPDNDIIYVSNAMHFISSGGNYGKLLNLVKK